jgi:hypothetical protein
MKLKKTFTQKVNEKQLKLIASTSVIHSKELQADGTYIIRYTRYMQGSYESIVNKLIAEKYTIQEELAIQRKHQKGVNVDEFNEYDAYVEECKVRARTFTDERNTVLSK